MDLDLKASIVLITSSDPKNLHFGTGFVIHHDEHTAFVLTCMHVVRDMGGPDHVKVFNCSARVENPDSLEGADDLAILRVEDPLDRPPLRLGNCGKVDQPFVTAGFKLMLSDQFSMKEISGRLGEQVILVSRGRADHITACELIMDDERLQKGYSGAPVVDEDGAVMGVVKLREGGGEKGLAICIEALEGMWSEVSSKLRREPVPQFVVPYQKHIAREYFGDREKTYERMLKSSNVICIWGSPGIGKTWVGAKLAIIWEKEGFSFSPYSDPPRQAFWFKCKEGMAFYDLTYGIAEYLNQQGEESLWHWLQSNPNRAKQPSEIIPRLTTLLNQQQYLLCFDDFHHASSDPEVRSLCEELETTLAKTSTKVVLIGRQDPKLQWVISCELQDMTQDSIQKKVLALKAYDKEWLNDTIAAKFADRLTSRFGANLALMNAIAIDWLRSNTTQAQAEAYLASLDEVKIADYILERGKDEIQAKLLTILSVPDEWEDESTLVELGREEELDEEDLVQALNALCDAGLVQEDRERYILHDSVRDLCQERQVAQEEDLSDLHRHVADIHSRKGQLLSSVDHYLQAEAFSEAIQILEENMLEITHSGGGERALEQLKRLQEVTTMAKSRHRDKLGVWVSTGDFKAWLGRLDAAEKAVESGFVELNRMPENKGATYKYEEARLELRLGMIFGAREELERALQHLKKSETLIRGHVQEEGITVQGKQTLVMVLNNLGIVNRLLTNFDEAIRSFNDCISESEGHEGIPHIDYTIPWAMIGLSQAYDERRKEGDQRLAVETAQQGLRAFEELKHRWGVSFANCTLGTIYLKLGDCGENTEHLQKAKEHHQQALKVARELEDRQIAILSGAKLAEINIIQREWSAVDEYMEIAKEAVNKAQIPPLTEYVSYFEDWGTGVKLLQEGQLDEGEQHLHNALKGFRADEQDYYEAQCVEKDLMEFGCSVPSETSPLDSSPSLAEEPSIPSTTPMEVPSIGSHIGRYEIKEELGSGAMGIVYKAYDPNVGRPVALKILHLIPGPHAQEMEQRFRREAQAAGSLSHPSIVTVHDAGVDQGRWYIVMECLEGKALSEIITQEGPQALEWVTNIVIQVCDALSYAHDRQVIHRDIKPSNIMVLDDGQIKVADFGLASVAAEADLTKSGEFLGTPRYASPEQILDSKQVDGRSDIFSLGVVVYELLTGESLFPGEHITPIHHITSPEPADLSKLSADLPDSIRQALAKALAKDADERYSTCIDFSEAFVCAAKDATLRPPEDKAPTKEKVEEKDMPDLSDLYDQIRKTLLDCGPLEDSGSLRAIFAHPKLSPWQSSLPHTSNPVARAEAVIDFLIKEHRADTKENALILLLHVLSERRDPATECHHRLADLADQLEGVLKSDLSTEQLTQQESEKSSEASILDPKTVSMIEKLVEEDKLERALTMLSNIEECQDEAIMFKGRLNRIQEQNRLGIVNLDYVNMERTRIASAILVLIRS